jgi:hypothetical protein
MTPVSNVAMITTKFTLGNGPIPVPVIFSVRNQITSAKYTSIGQPPVDHILSWIQMERLLLIESAQNKKKSQREI